MRPRLTSVPVVVAIVSVIVLAAVQTWFVFVVIPQQIRNAQPVIIDQALLLSDGPYVGCFDSLSEPGAIVVHQGQDIVLSWFATASSNVTPSCTIQSINGYLGPGTVIGSDLPVTLLTHQGGQIWVELAPLNYPYWGGVAIKVIETNP